MNRSGKKTRDADPPTATVRLRSLQIVHELVNRLRQAKHRLATAGPVGRCLVPLVEVFEFSLTHGLREVVVRARRRLRTRTYSSTPEVGTLPSVAAPVASQTLTTDVKLIAFYLPQDQPSPENDTAWGKGFTEWTNVTRARPLFDDHYQPHLPADLGFYDLRVPETREEQARLAKSYGIYGFCYYYYWFDRRRLLSRPLDEMLQSGKPDFPFCICWANEPWSRRWDGSDHEVIASQDYKHGYADRFIDDIMPILRDPRYIRVDGRPLLILYRLDHLPDPAAAAATWRAACRREGIGEICLAAMGTYGTGDPRPFGFDISIEFPPHNLVVAPTIERQLSGLHKEFVGRVFDYPACAEAEANRRPTYPQFRGLMASWDNTARRGESAMLFHNATPAAYGKWLRALLDVAGEQSAPHAPFVFINAWNEWAEGTHLEPDQKHGHQYLQATASALLARKYKQLFENGLRLQHQRPAEIAIVIPVYNHVDVTLACLDALARHRSRWNFEVIVVDDGSRDLTPRLVGSIPGVRYFRAQENQGFIRSCNLGAEAAEADYVVFLNNDTIVNDAWLDELRGTFDLWPNAGLVGSKLVWPNGRMQECGSLIYRDGSAENYGREGDPADPRYCYARETDYVTGAAIMISRRLFKQLNGFDELYAPAYYEDVDLAFKVRERGLRVVVNPLAVVTHNEGHTAGMDVGVGAKRYQVVNREKFRERWKSVLEGFPERGARERLTGRQDRILVIDWAVPRPDRDAGSVRIAAILRILRDLEYRVTFVSRDASYDPFYGPQLERMGIEVLRKPHIASVGEYLESNGREFGHVIVSRRDVAALHMEAVKASCPDARVIFDTVDLHFIREMRQREVEAKHNAPLAAYFDANRMKEIEFVKMADVTVVVSNYERDVLKSMFNDVDVRVVSTIHEPRPTPRAFRERAGLLFVGYFAHTPNADAVRWFVREVLPLIRLTDPEFRVHIVGSDPPDDILGMTSDRVTIHGYVADVEELFDRCKISIAPLRYGAGVKGKIGQSLALGVPCVTTSIGAEGMGLEDGVSGMIADSAADFAAKIERLYTDADLWTALRNRGFEVIERNMSVSAARRELGQLFPARRTGVDVIERKHVRQRADRETRF
jgi:GT2 family glycosyltransferase